MNISLNTSVVQDWIDPFFQWGASSLNHFDEETTSKIYTLSAVIFATGALYSLKKILAHCITVPQDPRRCRSVSPDRRPDESIRIIRECRINGTKIKIIVEGDDIFSEVRGKDNKIIKRKIEFEGFSAQQMAPWYQKCPFFMDKNGRLVFCKPTQKWERYGVKIILFKNDNQYYWQCIHQSGRVIQQNGLNHCKISPCPPPKLSSEKEASDKIASIANERPSIEKFCESFRLRELDVDKELQFNLLFEPHRSRVDSRIFIDKEHWGITLIGSGASFKLSREISVGDFVDKDRWITTLFNRGAATVLTNEITLGDDLHAQLVIEGCDEGGQYFMKKADLTNKFGVCTKDFTNKNCKYSIRSPVWRLSSTIGKRLLSDIESEKQVAAKTNFSLLGEAINPVRVVWDVLKSPIKPIKEFKELFFKKTDPLLFFEEQSSSAYNCCTWARKKLAEYSIVDYVMPLSKVLIADDITDYTFPEERFSEEPYPSIVFSRIKKRSAADYCLPFRRRDPCGDAFEHAVDSIFTNSIFAGS